LNIFLTSGAWQGLLCSKFDELIVKLKKEERILKRWILVFWAVPLFISERKFKMSFWVMS